MLLWGGMADDMKDNGCRPGGVSSVSQTDNQIAVSVLLRIRNVTSRCERWVTSFPATVRTISPFLRPALSAGPPKEGKK